MTVNIKGDIGRNIPNYSCVQIEVYTIFKDQTSHLSLQIKLHDNTGY